MSNDHREPPPSRPRRRHPALADTLSEVTRHGMCDRRRHGHTDRIHGPPQALGHGRPAHRDLAGSTATRSAPSQLRSNESCLPLSPRTRSPANKVRRRYRPGMVRSRIAELTRPVRKMAFALAGMLRGSAMRASLRILLFVLASRRYHRRDGHPHGAPRPNAGVFEGGLPRRRRRSAGRRALPPTMDT